GFLFHTSDCNASATAMPHPHIIAGHACNCSANSYHISAIRYCVTGVSTRFGRINDQLMTTIRVRKNDHTTHFTTASETRRAVLAPCVSSENSKARVGRTSCAVLASRHEAAFAAALY